jgi:cytochrome c peroxidase
MPRIAMLNPTPPPDRIRAQPLHRRRAVRIVAVLLAVCGCSGDSTQPEPQPKVYPPPDLLPVPVIPGVPAMQIPADNPLTVQGVALGRRLFHDVRLSGNNTQACASCHAPELAFSDHGRRFSSGIDGSLGRRNAPALTNVGFGGPFFWDGRAPTLEEQALEPVENPIEMNTTWADVVAKLRRDRDYPDLFGAAFGSAEITRERVVMAIAQFERTFVSANSRYDRWRRHEITATTQEFDGFRFFFTEIGECFHCHDPFQLSDRSFRDIGLDADPPDTGRYEVTGSSTDIGKFKVPTLRNVAVTAPYMHDGRFVTLEEVLEHYSAGGNHASPNLDPFLDPRSLNGRNMTAEQKQAIIAFLHMLTDSTFISNPDFSSP